MKRASVAAKPSGGSKRVLSDLLIIATVFVALTAFDSTVLATQGDFHVSVLNDQGAYAYYDIKGNQTTNQVIVMNGSIVCSFVCLYHPGGWYGEWMQVGWLQGLAPTNPPTWVSTPYYYVEHILSDSSYGCELIGPAPSGQSHTYEIMFPSYTMYAFIDGNCVSSVGGYQNLGHRASGETESYDTHNQMNSLFVAMQAGVNLYQLQAFHNDKLVEDQNPPYHASPRPPLLIDRWSATGRESS